MPDPINIHHVRRPNLLPAGFGLHMADCAVRRRVTVADDGSSIRLHN